MLIEPSRGYRNPAPTEARISRIGTVNPVGLPFKDPSWLDGWEPDVLALSADDFINGTVIKQLVNYKYDDLKEFSPEIENRNTFARVFPTVEPYKTNQRYLRQK